MPSTCTIKVLLLQGVAPELQSVTFNTSFASGSNTIVFLGNLTISAYSSSSLSSSSSSSENTFSLFNSILAFCESYSSLSTSITGGDILKFWSIKAANYLSSIIENSGICD